MAQPSPFVPKFCPRCGGRLLPGWVPSEGRERLVCGDCGRIEYQNPKVASCTLTRAHDGRILMVRRSIEPGYGLWVIPGGYVDLGETAEEAAIRETREETGVEVELEGLMDAYSYPDGGVVVLVYRARLVAGSPRAGDECLEVGLFGPRDVPWDRLAFPSTRDALAAALGEVPGHDRI